MKKNIMPLLVMACIAMAAMGQQVPQFAYDDFEGWTYNNPGMPLTPNNISGGKIFLYVGQDGLVLMLTSPQFCCTGMDSITARVNWYTPSFRDPGFELSRTALTLAIDNEQGSPIDSVTCIPTTTGTSRHWLNFAIAVPPSVNTIRMRLVSWQANVVSSGAVKQATFEAVSTPSPPPLLGDVDGDGELSVSDVAMVINQALGITHHDDITPFDLDHDGEVGVSDVSMLISMVLGRWP